MVSSAIAMMIGTEQTNSGSMTTDRSEGPNVSFAESFGKQVALPANPGLREASGDVEGMRAEKKSADGAPALPMRMNPEAVGPRMTSGVGDKQNGQKVGFEGKDHTLTNKAVDSESGRALAAARNPLVDDEKQIASMHAVRTTSQPKNSLKEAVVPGDRSSVNTAMELSEEVDASQKKSSAPDGSDIDPAARNVTATNRFVRGPEIGLSVSKQAMAPEAKITGMASWEKTASAHDNTRDVKLDSKSAKEPKKTAVEAPVANAVVSDTFQPVQSVAQSGGSPSPDEIGKETIGDSISISGVAAESRTKILDRAEYKDQAPEVDAAAKPAAASDGATEAQHALSAAGNKVAQTGAPAAPADKSIDERQQGTIAPVVQGHSAPAGDATIAGAASASGIATHLSPDTALKIQTGVADTPVAGIHNGAIEHDATGLRTGETEMGHRTLVATPTTLEVGIPNGTQGWLRVRADMASDGVVNASLSSTTSLGREQLHQELPALTSFLHEERIAVNTVVVHAAAPGGSGLRPGAGSDGGFGGQTPQHQSHGGKAQQQGAANTVSGHPGESMWTDLHGIGRDEVLSGETYTSGGSWLNVRV